MTPMIEIDWASVGITLAAISVAWGGYRAERKSLLKGNGNRCTIPLSEKTGGVLHISEEGLEKLTELSKRMDLDFMRVTDHEKMCKLERLQAQIDLSKAFEKVFEKRDELLKEMFQKQTETLLIALHRGEL